LQCAQAVDWESAKSIYEFRATDIDGNEVSLEKYK
jgi:glutathione peroxidase-family protein